MPRGYAGLTGLARRDLDINPEVLAVADRRVGLGVGPGALVVGALAGARGSGGSGRCDWPVGDTASAYAPSAPVGDGGLVPLRPAAVVHRHLVVPGGERDAAVSARHPAGPGRSRPRGRRVAGACDHALRADIPDPALSGQRRRAGCGIEPDVVQRA